MSDIKNQFFSDWVFLNEQLNKAGTLFFTPEEKNSKQRNVFNQQKAKKIRAHLDDMIKNNIYFKNKLKFCTFLNDDAVIYYLDCKEKEGYIPKEVCFIYNESTQCFDVENINYKTKNENAICMFNFNTGKIHKELSGYVLFRDETTDLLFSFVELPSHEIKIYNSKFETRFSGKRRCLDEEFNNTEVQELLLAFIQVETASSDDIDLDLLKYDFSIRDLSISNKITKFEDVFKKSLKNIDKSVIMSSIFKKW